MSAEHPDHVGLLRGELTNAEVLELGGHLEACDECRDELVALVTGHGLLAATMRALRPREPMETPWVPPLTVTPARPRWRRPAVLVAAAALVVAGAAVIPLVEGGSEGSTPTARRTAALAPVDGSARGRVVMTEGAGAVRMTITTRDLPRAARGDYYYAWLFEPATDKMLALGVVDPDGVTAFEVARDLVERYHALDVSLESDDGDPGHSITSVLRANYTPEASKPPSATK
ncbi:anti-sigma factor [Mumia sp. zg.B17]|uniref:anti-sigma factor domain-containing protein n=1 Tax=Mumia sp. zg.B17 TaxID=2855446 RepID=UPI001C6DE58E|nr:anti-sigma factor [Mumia sp. zg.B17]MBW9205831.1 anti-sigma factor [Mumia sp. zg.B17]